MPNQTHPYTLRMCGMFDGKKDNCDELIAEEFKSSGRNLSCFSCEKDLCNDADFMNEP